MINFFNWSYNDATSSDIPDGVYTAKISDIQESESSKGSPMWIFTFTLKEIPNAKFRVYQVIGGAFPPNITAMLKNKIAAMALCFSVPSGSNNINDWLGKCGYIRIFHKETQDGASFVNVKKFYTPDKGRAELFKFMQEKQAEAFFANSPSNPPDFNQPVIPQPVSSQDSHIFNQKARDIPSADPDSSSIDF